MRAIFTIIFFLLNSSIYSQIIKQQVSLEGNNIKTFIWNTGVFNQDLRTNNTQGLEWPKGSGKFACFTAGLCVGAYVNNQLRMGNASYNGEYRPGYSNNGQFFTDSRFRHYKVKQGDNYINNPDWLNWGAMVPYGAPYIDVNNSGYYEYFIDTPGVRFASETVFICLTDGDSLMHTVSEGFGGGTKPLHAEIHLTAWCYDNPGLNDIQFFKWHIINKSTNTWDSTIVSIVCDCDLGENTDDYTGCDTTRNLGFNYNADNMDGDGSGETYGANPPAFGITMLNCSGSNAVMSTCISYGNGIIPVCERDPSSATQGYWYMRGFKNDGTPYVNITNNQITKICYPGDVELNTGWTQYHGKIFNCGGSLTGEQWIPSPPDDMRFVINHKPANQHIVSGGSMIILAAQMVARGSNHKNSVTLLKQLSDSAKGLCQNGFVIGINPISSEIPSKFSLHQNYPNPFNPMTNVKFQMPNATFVKLIIYDAVGREITTLVNEKLNAGIYSIDWDGANYPSGVYFYQLISGSYTETRKMVLIK